MPDLIDLYIAFGLLVVVVVVYLANRVGVLPKKSLPILGGALAGAMGLVLFRRWQAKAADAQIAEIKRRIELRDGQLAEIETSRKLAHEELASARAKLDQQLAAAQRQRMHIVASDEEQRRAIDAADANTTGREYYRMLEEEARLEAQRRNPVPVGGGN